MSAPVISVRGLSKRYRLGGASKPYRTLRESIAHALLSPLHRVRRQASSSAHESTFWALREVSFDVQPGEVVGIIGRNGAGKSTLLKILSRITDPTEGSVELSGRVGSLLEVGTGFHPELTGRENIYLNGAILGMTRGEVRKKFDEIVSFAETERFLDTAVKYYSSGMYTRLAFSVAAHLEPDILVIDEVLAVGDSAFQKKCLGKMKDVAGQGRTVLFVSHNMTAVAQLCTTGIVLKGGRLEASGEIQDLILRYSGGGGIQDIPLWTRDSEVYDNGFITPERFAVVDSTGESVKGPLRNDQPYWVEIDFELNQRSNLLEIGYGLFTADGALVYGSFHTDGPEKQWPQLRSGFNRLRSPWPQHLLNEGGYRLELLAALHQQKWLLETGRNSPAISVEIVGGLSASPHFNHKRSGLLAPIHDWAATEPGQ